MNQDTAKIMGFYFASQKDEEGSMRALCRWYSKTFHTPLHEVQQMPLDEIAVVFWEEYFDKLDEHERQREIADLKDNTIYADAEVMGQQIKQSAEEISKFIDELTSGTNSKKAPTETTEPIATVSQEDLDFLEKFQDTHISFKD